MKTTIFFLFVALLFSSCWTRIGDLSMISNRNIDSSKEYDLLAREVKGIARRGKGSDALERALDKVTVEHKGEYLMNAKIYVKNNGKKIKVVGDVYGIKEVKAAPSSNGVDINVTSSVTKNIEFKTGDTVAFKKGGKLVEGVIVGINSTAAIVEFEAGVTSIKMKKEYSFDKLTKIDKK